MGILDGARGKITNGLNVLLQKTNDLKSSVLTSSNSIEEIQRKIENQLQKCRDYANDGYQIANRQYNEIVKTLMSENQRIKDASFAQDQISRVKNTQLIDQQKRGIDELMKEVYQIRSDIDLLRKQSQDFTIVVYGRTKVGKSTLMETLTHGNGQSIGKGAQRTTRDVRAYYWSGLRILDVPGVCYARDIDADPDEENRDEEIAYNAAKSADLILFLITDENPQPEEGEKLARLKDLGKPIIGLINVQEAFDLNRMEYSMKKLQRKFSNKTRIDEVCNQFKEFAKSHGQNWDDIPFVYTHLESAFLSQPERGNNPEVYQFSNFPQVEEFILKKFREDGKFLRLKNFIDIVANPMQEIIDVIYWHSRRSLNESYVYDDKMNQLDDWRGEFVERTQRRYDAFTDQLQAEIIRKLEDFVERNYANKNAGQDWGKVIERMNLPKRFQRLMQEFADECNEKRRELSDELTQEMKFKFQGDASASVEIDNTNYQLGLGIATAPLAIFGLPGIAIGLGINLIGNFFFNTADDKKKKVYDALIEPTEKMWSELSSKAVDVLNEEIIEKGIKEFSNSLIDVSFMLTGLAKAQSDIAGKLTKNFRNLNFVLFEEAIKYKQKTGNTSIANIARIPGVCCMIISNTWNRDTADLESLLGEDIFTIADEQNPLDLVRIILENPVDIRSQYLPSTNPNKEDLDEFHFMYSEGKIGSIPEILAQQVAGMPLIAIQEGDD